MEGEIKPEENTESVPKVTKKKLNKWWWIGGSIVIVLALGGSTYAFRSRIPFLHKNAVTTTTTTTTATTTPAATTPATTTSATITPIVDQGVTWITPEKLTDLGLIKADNTQGVTADTYYKVANLAGGGSIVIAKLAVEGPATTDFFWRFRQDKNGKYWFLSKQSGTGFDTTSVFTPDVIADSSTVYSQLSSPDYVVSDPSVTLTVTSNYYFFSELRNVTKIGVTQYGTLYGTSENLANQIQPAIKYVGYYLLHGDTTVTGYVPKIPFMSDDKVPSVTFGTTANTDKYLTTILASHCGSQGSASVVTGVTDPSSRFVEAGTTSTGDKVYYPASADDPIYLQAYDSYKIGRDTTAKSIADFVAAKPVFVWKDGFSEWVTFMDENYGAMAECGKPVVYLYPTKTTNVSLQVGANITKSDPIYADGWNVVASPDGKLSVGNQTYPYLFWEGKGNGSYPDIQAGFVVKKEDITATLKTQLSELGLNQKESADFMAFWLPKMPNTPFVRLTWLGTQDMNKLAPLSVSPKPDTTIRIFLDFEGLNNFINIPAQKLGSVPRKGFTLIEWGGLLIGN